MASLTVSGISPFMDLAGVLMFVEKISMYFLVGATLYFSRNTKQDGRHNADPSVHDTTSNESPDMSDARLTTEPANRDEESIAEIQRILTLINISTGRLDEIEQVLQTYHNNFGRVATEFESINGGISTLQNEMNRYYAVVQARNVISPRPIEDANQSEASSDSSQRSFSNTSLEIWNQFKIIFDKIMAEKSCSLDDMCGIVAADIINLGVGQLSKDIIKKYYHRVNDLKSSNLDKIGAWIDSKTLTRDSE